MEPARPPEDPSEGFSRARAASGALIRNVDGDVLMVQPTYKDFWDLPGGYVETGERPSEACLREVREELGIDIELGQLLVVDWAPAPNEGDKILFVFDGGRLAPEQEAGIALPEDELRSFAYQPLSRVGSITPPRLARRILHAAHAKSTVYLESGAPLSWSRPRPLTAFSRPGRHVADLVDFDWTVILPKARKTCGSIERIRPLARSLRASEHMRR